MRCRRPSALRSAGRRRNASRSWATAASASPSGELETIARLGLPITLVVIANATFGWIKAGQKTGFGGRYFAVDFTPGQHARIAEAYGIKAWRVEDPADLRPALAKALAAGAPTLVDIVTQPLHEARAPV